MDSQERARFDEVIARLDALEREVGRLEGQVARLSSGPAVTLSPGPATRQPARDMSTTAYVPDPYAPPHQQPPQPLWASQPTPPRSPDAGARPAAQMPPAREGNLGAYLLSGAAALLVLLAAVSLIALVWEQIPDGWKVGGLGLMSLAMVSAGTTLAENRPRLRVAAATVTGTGGALGFVTIIGAVLLVHLQAPVAMALMAAWGFVLLLVSWTAGQFFTAAVSALGALVTVGFAWVQANAHPGRAALVWVLVNGYLIALAAVSALLAHFARRMRHAVWLPTTSMAVTGTALVIGPTVLLRGGSPTGVALLCLPAVVLLVQAHHSGRLLSRTAGLAAAAWEWGAVGAAMVLAVLHLGLDPVAPSAARALTAVVLLAAAVASTAALLADGGAAAWPRNVAGVNLGVMVGIGAAVFAVEPRLLLPAVLAVGLAGAPVVRVGQAAPILILPLAGLPAFALATRAHSDRDAVGLALVAVATGVGLSLLLESRLNPARSPGRAQQARVDLLTAAVWLIGADLVVVLPALVARLVPGGSAAPLVGGVCALALAGLGLFTRGYTPLALASGARAGAIEGANGPRTPRIPATPVIGWVGFALLCLQALVVLVRADSADDWLVAAPLVVLGLALAVAAVRLLLPWLRRADAGTATAISLSVTLWWSVMILTGASATSLLVTGVVLATGAVGIVLGFRARAVALRHYGLTLVMLVVVKLAVLDLADGNSLTQILALLVAGLACFCLSLVYNRFAHEQAKRNAAGAVPAGGISPAGRGGSSYPR